MTETRVATGAWWDPEMWQRARAAYVFDLDHHPEAPAGFIGWLSWVLEAHAARGPQGRAALAVPPRAVIAATAGLNRHHALRAETRAAMEEAIIDDRQAGRLMSRSSWIHEAVVVAVQDAEMRAGGALPPVPDGQRLPNRPAKASPSARFG
ncbi:hypothetical protein [Cellulomonas sp. C5510]|uniref:hypothetical protein n=1 Tax=Cellulomonas sp. C5510 TaxID=2871170 RepID=UPI001C967F3A|nr:hypothetical protein [Cellulomonas sp. C5510]QZN87089.1 hypothetical protein K5O09_08300 [Cellulomonas sp. C5510]